MRGFYLYDPVDVDDDFGLIIKTCPDRSIFVRINVGGWPLRWQVTTSLLGGKSGPNSHDYDADFHNTIIWQELCQQIRSAP